MTKYLIVIVAYALMSGVALAEYRPGLGRGDQPDQDNLTWNGITLYGLVDLNLTYQTHGEASNAAYPVGIDYLVIGAKNANKSSLTLAPNGMNGSKIGVQGKEDLLDGWSAIFRAETEFNPLSGQLADGLKAMVQQNGIPLAAQRTAWGDSNKAGQLLGGDAYVGVLNAQFGTLTIGRHTSLPWDDLRKYDPLHGSLAFSLLGYSGQPSGAGDTEDRFLDKALKYRITSGPVRAAALYAFSNDGDSNGALQLDLGFTYQALSVDGLYSHIKDAVSASPLTTNATGTLSSAQSAALAYGGFQESNTLAATISDNTAFILNAMYDAGAPKFLIGYEHIRFANPSEPLTTNGFVDGLGVAQTIGGYDIITTNNAYTKNKVVQIYWAGARYDFSPKLEFDIGYYHLNQNNYSTSSALAGCTSSALSGQCSGNFNSVGMLAYYNLTKRFNLYAGAAWSKLAGGLANGYLNTSEVDPSIGLRFMF